MGVKLVTLQGGFQQSMTRREAALILGIREHAKEDIVKDAHRKIMIANHPDAGQAFLCCPEMHCIDGRVPSEMCCKTFA